MNEQATSEPQENTQTARPRLSDELCGKHLISADCWCEPEKIYVDEETGDAVYLHREIH